MWTLAFALAAAAEPGVEQTVELERVWHADVVITDDNEIVEMIKHVVTREIPGLRECYDPRLAEIPDLRGRYRLEFVVLRDGTVRDARATFEREKGVRADEPLRSCLEDHVAAWQFYRIEADQPVLKTVTFHPPQKEEPGRP